MVRLRAGNSHTWPGSADHVLSGGSRPTRAVLRPFWPRPCAPRSLPISCVPLVQTRPGFVGTVWITLLFVAPVAAWRLGAWRSAIVYFLGDWAGSLLILMTLGAASLLGSTSAHQYWTTHDVGSSSGVYALGFAAALTLPGRVRVAVVAAVIAVFTSRVVIAGRVFDYQHAVSLAAAVGVVRLMSLGHAPNDLIPQAGKYGPRTQGPRARSHCSAPESIAEDLLDRSNQRT